MPGVPCRTLAARLVMSWWAPMPQRLDKDSPTDTHTHVSAHLPLSWLALHVPA